MKTLELKQMEFVEGGRPFWGTGTVTDCSMALLTNTCTVCSQDYIFWIAAGSTYNCSIVQA